MKEASSLQAAPARSELRPPGADGSFRGPVALSPNGRTLAFRREARPGVYDLCVSDAREGRSSEKVLVRGPQNTRIIDLQFSPTGRHLALSVRQGGQRAGVAVASLAESQPLRPLPGAAIAFWPDGESVVVAGARPGLVEEHAVDEAGPGARGRGPRVLARLEDATHPRLPMTLAPSPDGRRLAVVTRSVEENRASVWLVAREGAGDEPFLLTDIPGAWAKVHPVFSPDGESLALHVVHLTLMRTGIIALPGLEGGGEIWYDADFLDPALAPAWSPDGLFLAFFRTACSARGITPTGPASLTLLDVERAGEAALRRDAGVARRGALRDLSAPGSIDGRVRFLDRRALAVEAHDGAHVFSLEHEA